MQTRRWTWDKNRQQGYWKPYTSKKRVYALSFIHNNEVSVDNPYTLLVSTASKSIGSVTIALVETNGERPPKIDKRCKSLKKIIEEHFSVHCGSTKKCEYRRLLPGLMQQRDAYNLIHRIKLRKQKLTVELMQSITDPEMRQKLVEAVCLAAA